MLRRNHNSGVCDGVDWGGLVGYVRYGFNSPGPEQIDWANSTIWYTNAMGWV